MRRMNHYLRYFFQTILNELGYTNIFVCFVYIFLKINHYWELFSHCTDLLCSTDPNPDAKPKNPDP